MHNMAERPAIERVGPMGEDNGPTPKPQGSWGYYGLSELTLLSHVELSRIKRNRLEGARDETSGQKRAVGRLCVMA